MSPSLKNCYVVIYIAISINVVIVIVKGDDRERKQIDVYTDVSQLEQCASVVSHYFHYFPVHSEQNYTGQK